MNSGGFYQTTCKKNYFLYEEYWKHNFFLFVHLVLFYVHPNEGLTISQKTLVADESRKKNSEKSNESVSQKEIKETNILILFNPFLRLLMYGNA